MAAQDSETGLRRDAPRVAARARFDRLLAGDPALAALDLGEILRLSPQSLVAKGWLDAVPVVLKLFLGPQAGETVVRMAAELDHLAAHMGQGRWQVNRMLLARPDLGLAVLSALPGEKMSRLLPTATPAARARMLADAGGFALAYGAGRRQVGAFAPAFWLRRFDRLDAAAFAAPDRDLLAALHTALARQAKELRGAPVCRAAVHGDFVPANLHADEDGVYGFDTQGEAVMPLSLDLARFMAWLAMEELRPQGPHWHGVALADKAAFLGAGLPPPEEHPGILPFLLGIELAGRFAERLAHPERAPAARRALGDYLAAP